MHRVLALAVLAACGGASPPAVSKAGDNHDEGAGELARASIRLWLGGGERTPTPEVRRRHNDDIYGGDPYGGGAYGGDPYGGASYAGWTVPVWSYSTPNRTPTYTISNALPGVVEGVVTWTGAAPGRIKTACGVIDNPTLRVGSDKTMRGVLVFIEKVSVGRAVPYYGRPAAVGGVVTKHGCALLPAAQIVAPLPASLAIHGDNAVAKVQVNDKSYDLQQAGVVNVEIKPGATRVDGANLVPAWVMAIATPYYAITDDAGKFRIDELAAGTYDITFWQPPIAMANVDGTIAVGAPIVVHRTVRVDAGKPARLDVALH
jgi:hypothetical protein